MTLREREREREFVTYSSLLWCAVGNARRMVIRFVPREV